MLTYQVKITMQTLTPAAQRIWIYCDGSLPDKARVLTIWFVPKDEVPASNQSYLNPHNSLGIMFAPIELYPSYVDLLRNEQPVWARVGKDPRENSLYSLPR